MDRALDKLRGYLGQRGIGSSSAALATFLANQTITAAPAYLAANVASIATEGMAVAASGTGLAATLTHFMSMTKITFGAISAIAVLAIGTTLYEAHEVRSRQAALNLADEKRADLQTRIQILEQQLQAESKKARAADEDSGKLLKAAEGIHPKARITVAMATDRFRHARELAAGGDLAGALKEYMWCFDEGMAGQPSLVGVRLSYVILETAKLGQQYPEALAALRERRDAALHDLQADSTDTTAIADFASLNGALGDASSTLALFDQLGPNDPARRTLGMWAYGALVTGQRYSDALQARPFAQMVNMFSSTSGIPAAHDEAVQNAAADIEVLAGAGDIADAQTLANKVLAFDGSSATKAALQAHLGRAGHADLLAPGSSQ